MTVVESGILLAGGLAAGVVNTLAGGGSLLSVPLLVLLGLPATLANGTNRIGVLFQSATGLWRFRAEGLASARDALPVVLPVCAGSLLGAVLISRASDAMFSRLFGVVMLLLLVPMLRRPAAHEPGPRTRRAAWLRALLFFGIGLYGGALQAGVGILLVLVLSLGGFDLLRANGVKLAANFAMTAVAVPVFVAAGQVAWAPALLLGAGFAAGGELGARLAIRGGERLIRPALTIAVVVLAARMLGLY